jgi:hypothetical protein
VIKPTVVNGNNSILEILIMYSIENIRYMIRAASVCVAVGEFCDDTQIGEKFLESRNKRDITKHVS